MGKSLWTKEGNAIELKKAGLRDAEAVFSIQRRAFAALLEKYRDYETSPAAEPMERTVERLTREGSDFYIVEEDGKQIGLVRVQKLSESEYWLGQLCLLPEARGKGAGKRLLAAVESLYPQAAVWTLSTIKQEGFLLRFYEKAGYRRTGREETIKEGMDLIFYEKIR